MAPPKKRTILLQNAEQAINGDRDAIYGSAEINFKRTAALLNAMGYQHQAFNGKVRGINSTDIALIMTQVKLSRLVNTPDHEDSWMDAAGYIALGGELALPEETPEQEVCYTFGLVRAAHGRKRAKFQCPGCGVVLADTSVFKHMDYFHPEVVKVITPVTDPPKEKSPTEDSEGVRYDIDSFEEDFTPLFSCTRCGTLMKSTNFAYHSHTSHGTRLFYV